jgi:hypothetical protein
VSEQPRIFPGAVYDQKVMNDLVNLMFDTTLLSLRPLPARRIFASYWRVLHIDGFAEAYNRAIQFFSPSLMDILDEWYIDAGYKPIMASDALSPYNAWPKTVDKL